MLSLVEHEKTFKTSLPDHLANCYVVYVRVRVHARVCARVYSGLSLPHKGMCVMCIMIVSFIIVSCILV